MISEKDENRSKSTRLQGDRYSSSLTPNSPFSSTILYKKIRENVFYFVFSSGALFFLGLGPPTSEMFLRASLIDRVRSNTGTSFSYSTGYRKNDDTFPT